MSIVPPPTGRSGVYAESSSCVRARGAAFGLAFTLGLAFAFVLALGLAFALVLVAALAFGFALARRLAASGYTPDSVVVICLGPKPKTAARFIYW